LTQDFLPLFVGFLHLVGHGDHLVAELGVQGV
jgi:hypothetical protein